MKFKEFTKKMLKHKKLVLGIILLVIVSLLVIRIINNKNKVDVDHLLSELKKSIFIPALTVAVYIIIKFDLLIIGTPLSL